MTPEERLTQLGFAPEPPPHAAANYRLCVLSDGWAHVSGCLPMEGARGLVHTGKLGVDQTLDQGQEAARLCAVNILRILKSELGTLDRIEHLVRLGGYVNCSPDFTDIHLVMNGASTLMTEVLGAAGHHARSAIGVASLPLGASVEVDAIVRVRETIR